jgi:hypothetical protein
MESLEAESQQSEMVFSSNQTRVVSIGTGLRIVLTTGDQFTAWLIISSISASLAPSISTWV